MILALAFAVLVQLDTDAGRIVLEVNTEKAPVTANNFLRYVREGAYTGGAFHRTVRADNQPSSLVKIDVIQGGPKYNLPPHAPVKLERTNATGLKHLDGTVSMARSTPDSATSDFFICLGDQPELDYAGKRNPDGQGFAAFGRVVEGMDTVRKIHQSPAERQSLTPVIVIQKAQILPTKGAAKPAGSRPPARKR